jgi:hypothetical protein
VFLSDADLAIEQEFGDRGRQPLTRASPEIITIARRAPLPPPITIAPR